MSFLERIFPSPIHWSAVFFPSLSLLLSSAAFLPALATSAEERTAAGVLLEIERASMTYFFSSCPSFHLVKVPSTALVNAVVLIERNGMLDHKAKRDWLV
jgi:hypothetical protein